MADSSVVSHLVELGFSELEASVYVAMLRESPQTGYQVAKKIGKPVANTYKAVQALRRRGAVLADAREPKLCRAVPIEEILRGCEQRFRRSLDRAASAARRLRSRPATSHWSRIESATHAVERARHMIHRARAVLMVDAFPTYVDQLAPDLRAAAARGVRVAALVYGTASVKGVLAIMHPRAADARARWPGGWLNLVADSSKDLIAAFTADGELADGTISDNAVVAVIHESGLFAELMAARLLGLIAAGASTAELQRAAASLERFRNVRGLTSAALPQSGKRRTRRRRDGVPLQFTRPSTRETRTA